MNPANRVLAAAGDPYVIPGQRIIAGQHKLNVIEQMFEGLSLVNDKDLFDLIHRLKVSVD